MLKKEKSEFVDWMKGEFNSAQSVVIADYRGLNVAQITELRTKCREVGVFFQGCEKYAHSSCFQRHPDGINQRTFNRTDCRCLA